MIRVLLIGLLAAAPALAAGPPDPDWPCIQRRQPHLSIAQVWGGPVPDAAVLELAARAGVEMPIAAPVGRVLYEGVRPRDAVLELMAREPKAEG